MDCSLPGSSVHGILQARLLESVAIPFFRGSSRLRNPTWGSSIAGKFFTIWATREAPKSSITWSLFNILSICELLGRQKGILPPAWNAFLLSKMLRPLGLVKSQLFCYLSSGCWNGIPGTGQLNDRRLLLSLCLKTGESVIKVLADSVPGEGFLLGSQVLTFSPCLHMVDRWGESASPVVSS